MLSDDRDVVLPPPPKDAGKIQKLLHGAASWVQVAVRHTTKHTGVGIVCAVAYFDPGNWGVDLQAGSSYGYKLLFVVLLAGIFAIFMQTLASRLGCVTGLDLAAHCRLLLYNRPKHTRFYRWGLLYPLYVLSEICIISTDLAELLGSAIALCMLFPAMPLWAGVLVTASDVLLLLAIRDPMRGRPVRVFEIFIGALVFIVLGCMAAIISKSRVDWAAAFDGFVPSKAIFQSGGLYTSIGIIGATVMPHSLFVGSALATQDRMAMKVVEKTAGPLGSGSATSSETELSVTTARGRGFARTKLHNAAAFMREQFRILPAIRDAPTRHSDRENNSYHFVRRHLYHGIVDMVISLLGLAVVINAMILILAASVFYTGSGESEGPASLFDAYDLLRDTIGKPAAVLFALALLASGQSSSIIATLAGQIVSEGFIQWRLSPMMRRLFTRCLGLIPSLVVAAGVGRRGVDTLLVASQVCLSIVLPFIVLPLLLLTASKKIMSVKKPELDTAATTAVESEAGETVDANGPAPATDKETDAEAAVDETVDFSAGKVVIGIGYAIWAVVVVANVYAIVMLGLGEG